MSGPKSLQPAQTRRYARHILLPDVGGVGQQRLLSAQVAVRVGIDASAEAVALAYLAAAGVGRIFLTGDTDGPVINAEVDQSVVLGREDVGKPRGEAFIARLTELNPEVLVSLSVSGPPQSASVLEIVPQGTEDRSGLPIESTVVTSALVDGSAAAAQLIANIARGSTP